MAFNSKSKDVLMKQFELGVIGKMLGEHHKEHNVLTPEDIEKLIEREKKK